MRAVYNESVAGHEMEVTNVISMRKIVDEGVLFLYGTVIMAVSCLSIEHQVNIYGMGRDSDIAAVVAFLLACIYMCVNLVRTSLWCQGIVTLVYVGVGVFLPEMWMFLPVVMYNVRYFYTAGYLAFYVILGAGLTLYASVVCINTYGAETAIFIIAGAVMAVLFQRRTTELERLEAEYKKTRDDSKELTLMLEQKNRNLLEKQDAEVYMATLKERNRIAREIHDNVGHMLSRSILMVGALKAVNQNEQLELPLEQLDQTLNEAMTNVRESVHDLHDESVNLKEVLESLTEEFTFCPVQLEYDMGYDLPKEIKYSFIAIVKEALNNVMRHSNATKVHVLVREHPWLYQLIIEDNGSVGDAGSGMRNMKEAESGGIGIQNMRERVRMLGGTMQVKQKDGFRIFITVPKKNE